jgi:ferredoxin
MNIREVRLVYFSPTHTTRQILEGIARGFPCAAGVHIDLTSPASIADLPAERDGVLAVIGSPVYGGRLPLPAVSRLQRLMGHQIPAVLVVVYGNRAYEDALLELRNLSIDLGFVPVAAGAFIGEHSYSTPGVPIAPGRPDGDDLQAAEQFGRMIHGKLRAMNAAEGTVDVPGRFPYKERMGGAFAGISPETDETLCARCANCQGVCPTGAISLTESAAVTNKRSCIRCCACVRVCSTGARAMSDPRLLEVARWLNVNCLERKQPETYL